jgi:hypothetical protein
MSDAPMTATKAKLAVTGGAAGYGLTYALSMLGLMEPVVNAITDIVNAGLTLVVELGVVDAGTVESVVAAVVTLAVAGLTTYFGPANKPK